MVVIQRSDTWLEHHGIKGQAWGKRNGPPYPLDYENHSKEQKKLNPKSELNNYENNNPKPRKNNESNVKAAKKKEDKSASGNASKEKAMPTDSVDKKEKKSTQKQDGVYLSQGNHDLASNLGITDEEAAVLKKRLKTAGIIVGTTAAVVAAAYLYNNNSLEKGYNRDGSKHAIGLEDSLFNNRANKDYVGSMAKWNGYDKITSNSIKDAITNPAKNHSLDYDELVQDVRLNQIEPDSKRRLSCWSASNAYFMSAMTGKEYVSKSFENLVDFNDFGKLYTNKPEIYTITGRKASDFVGKFGKLGIRGGKNTTDRVSKSLIKSIFANIDEANNLSADGSRTIGFINAGYHSTTCTHQFNFEMVHLENGFKDLIITDGYSGDRYYVASLAANGKVDYDTFGLIKFAKEVHHYNAESFRFYAPSLESINPDMMANVILGKS